MTMRFALILTAALAPVLAAAGEAATTPVKPKPKLKAVSGKAAEKLKHKYLKVAIHKKDGKTVEGLLKQFSTEAGEKGTYLLVVMKGDKRSEKMIAGGQVARVEFKGVVEARPRTSGEMIARTLKREIGETVRRIFKDLGEAKKKPDGVEKLLREHEEKLKKMKVGPRRLDRWKLHRQVGEEFGYLFFGYLHESGKADKEGARKALARIEKLSHQTEDRRVGEMLRMRLERLRGGKDRPSHWRRPGSRGPRVRHDGDSRKRPGG